MMSQQRLLAFVHNRIDAMERRPQAWAGGQEAFILQLALLVELTYVGKGAKWSAHDTLQSMCGDETCAVPNGPITQEWASATCDVARKHLRRGVW